MYSFLSLAFLFTCAQGHLRTWLKEEVKRQTVVSYGLRLGDIDDWTAHPLVSYIQRQSNGFDCGVFICAFLDFLVREKRPSCVP